MLTRTDHPFTPEESPNVEPVGFDQKAIFALIRRLWIPAAIGSVIFLGLAIAYLCVATPLYTADTSILLDTQTNEFLRKQNVMADPTVDTGVVDSQVEVLNSESIALSVIHKLHLDKDPEFVGPPKGLLGKIMVDASAAVASLKKAVGLSNDDAAADDTPERQAVTVFGKRLTVKRAGITYVINISFSAESAKKSAEIANAISQAYIDGELAASFATTSRASQWLQGRLRDIRHQATDADRAVQTYKSENGIVDTGKGLMNQQQISDLNSQIIAARTQTAEAKARLDRIQHVTGHDILDATVTDALANAVITRLRAQYLDLQTRLADLSGRLGRNHDAVIKVRDQMSEIKKAISNEVQRIGAGYASDYEISKARQLSLETSLATLVGEAGTTDLAQVKLRDLESSAESYRQLYDGFLQKSQEVTQQQTSPMTATRVITNATVPLRKSSPKSLLILIGALLFGAAAGGGIGYLRDAGAENTLSTPDEVFKVTGTPCLGTLPDLDKTKRLRAHGSPGAFAIGDKVYDASSFCEYVLDVPFSRYAETFRGIKIAIDQGSGSAASKVVAVTSSAPKEGKTTVAMNLASLVASYGTKTLIIDGDLHDRGLSRLFGADSKQGLIEALADPKQLSNLVLHRPRSGLDILPCVLETRPTNASELISSEAMKELLAIARDSYDFVIVDLPPIAPVVDGKAAAHLFDDFVFVVGWGRTSQHLVAEALSSAEAVRERLVGIVLNQADPVELRRIESYRSRECDAYYVG